MPNYTHLDNPSVNLSRLIAEQNAEGLSAGLSSGKEPFDVLAAKAIFNSSEAATDPNLVRGPSSSSDNRIARFDGTTGKVVQSSSVSVDDSGNISGAGSISASGNVSIGGNVSVVGTIAASGLNDSDARNARAPRQGLVCNGSQTAGGTSTLGSSIGTSAFSRFDLIDCPASAPSAILGIGTLSSSSSAATTVSGWEWYINTSGDLVCAIYGAAFTDYYRATVAGFVSSFAGKRVLLGCVRATSGELTLYANGVALSASISTGGTNPTAQGSITSTCAHVGISGASNQYPFAGYVAHVGTTNRALSAAEVLRLFETGAPDASDYGYAGTPASNTNILTGNDTTFAGAGNWSLVGGGTVSGGALNLGAGNNASWPNNKWRRGTYWRVRLNVTTNNGVRITNGYVNLQTTSGTGWIEYTIQNPGGGSADYNYLYLDSTGAGSVIADCEIYPLGLLLAPEANAPGNGYQWKDMSGNKADITLPVSGVSWALPDVRNNQLRATLTWSASHEAKAIGVVPANAVITSVVTTASAGSSGSGLTVGSVTTPNLFVAAAAYTTAKKVQTLAAQLPAGTATNDLTLVIDPDTSNYTGSIQVAVNYFLAQ